MIRFEALTKRFGPQVALESLTLEVRRGEAVALLGPNGSGKTTSLKAAAGPQIRAIVLTLELMQSRQRLAADCG